MEEIKAPKKERKFLKAMGDIALTLFRELVLGIGKKVINKVGNKRQGLVITSIILASTFAIAQFPNTLNKQRLGFQTTADGLVWRGSISDTASIQPINNQNAWVILDTINLKFYTFDFTSNVWNLVGGAAFTQPVDSLFFNVNVSTNNVDTAKMRWDSDLATVVLGLNDNVPNEIGFKNFWLVKNQTGSTITKGSLVYANGTVGVSGRITVDKFIANGSIDAKYLLGITAHDLTDGEDGYVISYGKIRQISTDTFAAGAILYPSPTVAGVWTDVEPIAPNIDMPIGFCINSSSNNGTIAIRVASGYKLSELHDVAISSAVEKASLYYSGGLWRDTTAALLVSDTASMLTPYLRKADTTNMLLPYFRDADTSLLNLTSRFAAKQNTLTNPVLGTGTNNFVPKFTSTGSTIGNSTIQDNGTTVSTSSILSTTNYASFNTTQVVGTSSGMLSTHRFTSANANGLYDKNWFLTSYMGAPWQGSDVGAGNRSKPPIVAIINNNDSNLINSGLHLMTTKSNNNTYTPAITFGVNSENEVYYNTIGAITAKKLNTGQFTSQSAGQLEFFGTGTALDTTGASMTTANMTLGVGVGIGYTTAPTVRGRLTVLEKLGINQSTPAFALDVSGTANITGATTLGSTLNVTGNLGINTTSTSGANLIIKNSQEPSRATVVTTQTFAADTTNWTKGTGWTFSGGVAVATAATGDLTYTPSLTITSGNAYEITYTVTNYTSGTLSVILGNGTTIVLPTYNVTNFAVITLPTTATGGLRFTTSLFTGNLDNVSVVEITGVAPVLFAGQDDGSTTLYNSLRMPNSTTLAFGGGGARTTGTNNNFFGINTGQNNTTGINNNFFGNLAGQFNISGAGNSFFGTQAGRNNITGGQNNFFGELAGLVNTTGSANNFFGSSAGRSNLTGGSNNFFGTNSGRSNLTGGSNNFFGTNSGFSNTTGGNNNFFGVNTGFSNTTGSSNIAIGNAAMYNTTVGDTLAGSNNIAIGTNAGDNIEFAAAGNVAIGNGIDFPDPSGSNQVVIKNVYFATGASGAGTGIAALSKAGIKTNAPNRDLEVAGEVRITDLTTDTPTRLVGADADGDLGQVTLGSTLSLTGSSLGVTSNTFLPLTGGTLTGGLTGTTGTFTGLNVNGLFKFGGATNYLSQNFDNGGYYSEITGSSSLNRQIRFQGLNDAGTKYTSINLYTGLATIILKTDEFNKMELTNNILVINEDSQDTDFRVESDGNANMVFVDASTDRVGIGTASPTKTLDVNGELNVSSAGTFGGRVKTNWLERNYAYSTTSSFTISDNTTWQDVNTSVLTTITLPDAPTYPGKELHIRQTGTGQIVSFSSNVIPFTSPPTGSAGTAILNPTNNKAVTLVSDGTNWIIMQRSGN